MLVPVREYATAAEMIASITAIRNGFRTWQPPTPPPVAKPSESQVRPDPIIFLMTADMATPPDIIVMRRVTVTEILRAVSDVWGVRVIDIISQRRTHNVMRPRQAVYALSCELTVLSLPQIGRAIGGRDHTTVLHGKNKMRGAMDAVRSRMPADASVRQWAEEVKREMDR